MYDEGRDNFLSLLLFFVCFSIGCILCLGELILYFYIYEFGDIIINGVFFVYFFGVEVVWCGFFFGDFRLGMIMLEVMLYVI